MEKIIKKCLICGKELEYKISCRGRTTCCSSDCKKKRNAQYQKEYQHKYHQTSKYKKYACEYYKKFNAEIKAIRKEKKMNEKKMITEKKIDDIIQELDKAVWK